MRPLLLAPCSPSTSLLSSLALVAAVALALPACGAPEGCLAGDDGTCLPPSACRDLAYVCDSPLLEVRTVLTTDQRPPGVDALAAAGDIVLANDRLRVVIDAIDAPHYLAPTGGAILDLVVNGQGAGDSLNHIMQTVGILPDDAAAYHTLDILDRAPDYVAVVARGRLDGYPDIDVVTRYELRPCEPGVRVRTELYHHGRDPIAVSLADVFYWGDRQMTPFVPLVGQGFEHPELDFVEIDQSYRRFPWAAASDHRADGSSYAVMSCDRDSLDGFHASQISVAGLPRTMLLDGDGVALERFILAAAGPGLSGVINNVLPARSALTGDAFVTVSGSMRDGHGDPLGGDERLGSLLIYRPAPGDDPDEPAGRTPVAEVVPRTDGSFQVRVPAHADYRIQRYAFGRPLVGGHVDFTAAAEDVALDPIDMPAAGLVTATVTDGAGAPIIAELVLVPTGPTGAADVDGSVYGFFDEAHCAPYLGPPHAGSPACNRVLVDATGATTFAAPAGTFFVYATRGPFWTLARGTVEVVAGDTATVDLSVAPLSGLVPDGALSADFHVHAGASFDSSFPERERALTFVSQGVDVIAATDHDVVTDYQAAIAAQGLGDQVRVMPGMETTGHILFLRPPGSEVPKVVGHYNFWPLEYDPLMPKNGGPDDESMEPGAIFDLMEALSEGRAVRQLNHPLAESLFGRDEGYFSAVEYDWRVAVPSAAGDTPEGQLARRPGGPDGARNIDHHVQEVMNGTSTHAFLKYRQAWFSLLNQGLLRGGTANSDSHSLAVEVLGSPRNLVFAGMGLADFDVDTFNGHVKQGRMIGTNGPVIVATIDAAGADPVGPSLSAFEPASGAELHVEVRAAPWIPVDEVRVIVNGVLETTWTVDESLRTPEDPFGTGDLVRFQTSVALDGLLPAGDAWIVIEAGRALHPAADLDDDGSVETTDNNGDGVIDDADQADPDEDTWFQEPPSPAEDASGFHHQVVAPGAWSAAFTNPFLVDRDGDGWTAPGLIAQVEEASP